MQDKNIRQKTKKVVETNTFFNSNGKQVDKKHQDFRQTGNAFNRSLTTTALLKLD
jgi:hypothetical protein